ncbi:hypothetical protein VNI00_018614 [Paramarasmius palmivorus]|uniref:Nephrocystin 3-like N-terminal domain-containing protein n=1 Tax=Paramarasmius palmivorus TaxID=297713 RepID=A0AAW0AVZ1_9AGAR
MQTLSEKHACKGKLHAGTQPPRHVCVQGENACHHFAASFFFSRNDPTRDKLDPLVATIIYQFLTSEPLREVLGPTIIEAVRSNPGIFQLSFEDQLRKLVLEPCSNVDPQEWKNLPNLIVIDGLDECVLLPSQERLLLMIRQAIPGCPLIFLIASRPEPRICRAFEHEAFSLHLQRLAIGDSSESTQDITTFFHHRFAQLQDTHHAFRYIEISWPGENVIWELARRASGQFIFAETVMKYLENDDEVPTERLQAILRIRAEDLPESPYPELDLLYDQILQACPKWDEVSKILRLLLPHGIRVPSTLASRISIDWHVPQTPEFIAALFNFEPGKLQSLLFRLHSVIKVPSQKEEEIDILHASFTDYLLVPARSRAWHIEPYTESEFYDLLSQTFLRAISIRSQRYLQTMQSHTPQLPDEDTLYLSDVLGIRAGGEPPIFVVFDLIRDVVSPSDELIAALNQFDPYPFATWLLNWSAFHGRDNGVAYWMATITWAEVRS